jgi:hypothetical protein
VILQLKVLTLDFFCGARFSRSLSPNEIESSIPNDQVSGADDDKTMVKVLTITPITKGSARM